MPEANTLSKNLMHIAFLCICIAGFCCSCVIFLFYRLLLKPLVFALILLAALPLAGKEMIKRHSPVHTVTRHK